MKYVYLVILTSFTACYSMQETQPSTMINKINAAVERNDHAQALQWYTRLKLLVSADWKWLDSDQIERWSDISDELSHKVENIEPHQIKSLGFNLARDIETSKKEAAWMIAKVESDSCVDINWRNYLGIAKIQTIPSPWLVKQNRLENLRQTGTVQPMNK